MGWGGVRSGWRKGAARFAPANGTEARVRAVLLKCTLHVPTFGGQHVAHVSCRVGSAAASFGSARGGVFEQVRVRMLPSNTAGKIGFAELAGLGNARSVRNAAAALPQPPSPLEELLARQRAARASRAGLPARRLRGSPPSLLAASGSVADTVAAAGAGRGDAAASAASAVAAAAGGRESAREASHDVLDARLEGRPERFDLAIAPPAGPSRLPGAHCPAATSQVQLQRAARRLMVALESVR
eukprot:354510-Chlamydomonas_euryale.AAC.6